MIPQLLFFIQRRTCPKVSVDPILAHIMDTQTVHFHEKKKIFFQFGRFVAFNIVCWNKQTNDMAKRNNNSNNLFDKCVITEQIKTKTKPSNFMSLDFSLFVHHLSFFSWIISFSLSACTTFNALVSNSERVNEKRIKQNNKRTTFSSAPKIQWKRPYTKYRERERERRIVRENIKTSKNRYV